MRTVELARTSWSEYFAEMALEHAGTLTRVGADRAACAGDVRVTPGGAGAHRTGPAGEEAPARPLRAISFDGAQALIELSVGGISAEEPGVRYYVEDPRRIAVAEADGARTIFVIDGEGGQTLVSLLRGGDARPPGRRRPSPPRMHRRSRRMRLGPAARRRSGAGGVRYAA